MQINLFGESLSTNKIEKKEMKKEMKKEPLCVDGVLCDQCMNPADILVHNNHFCMQHYEIYYYTQSLAVLPFEFIM